MFAEEVIGLVDGLPREEVPSHPDGLLGVLPVEGGGGAPSFQDSRYQPSMYCLSAPAITSRSGRVFAMP